MSRGRTTIPGLILLGLLAAPVAHGQCMLANPSFELGGSGGQVFAAWNQFGVFGSSTDATHGTKAARVTGPDTGVWDVSGYWQALVSAPGERWTASVTVKHSATSPLAGGSAAILNIEWRDAGGGLISYESHVVASPSTPAGEAVYASVESGAAPAGTATVRLLLGVLQGPSDPVPVVTYDQARFERIAPPGAQAVQWNDFPGARALAFAGSAWRVKGPGYYGPGPNLFCDDPTCVWVDGAGAMHLTIRKIGGAWYSTEVTLEEDLGYGDYVFTILGHPDTWHPRAVAGLFLWEYGPCYDPAYLWWNPHNEIDVELSRWGNPANDVAQFVAQPYDYPGNLVRFDPTAGDPERVSYAFRWLPDRVEFRSWRGGPGDESTGTLIHTLTYTGPHVPRPDRPRVHVNFWQFDGPPDVDQELVVEAFTFTAACEGPLCVTAVADRTPPSGLQLAPPRPNPMRDFTAIRLTVPATGDVALSIVDVSGRRVRALATAPGAGPREIVWDGRDDAGRRVAPGVYLLRMRAGDAAWSRRLVVLR